MSEPRSGTVYRRKTDGHRLKYAGDPGPNATPTGWRGWIASGPAVYGKLVGEAWGWPWVYEVDRDQSWPVGEET